MTLAFVVGLLQPALEEGGPGAVAAGLSTGAAPAAHATGARGSGGSRRRAPRGRRPAQPARLVVLLVHSLPEGFAIGTAYASDRAGLSVFVILAIALQNIPEGTSVAIPMRASGFTSGQQFWAAVATSAPQPVGAVVAFVLVEFVTGLLPAAFAFAAGAMLSLVAVELVPQAFTRSTWRSALVGLVAGAGVMVLLSVALGCVSRPTSCADRDAGAARPVRKCGRSRRRGSPVGSRAVDASSLTRSSRRGGRPVPVARCGIEAGAPISTGVRLATDPSKQGVHDDSIAVNRALGRAFPAWPDRTGDRERRHLR